MDGGRSARLIAYRLSLLASPLLGGLVGCNGLFTRSADGPPGQVQSANNLTKATQNASPPPPAPSPVVAASAKAKASPSMFVTMGAVAEQVAEDADRPQPEREAARRQARQSYQKAIDIDTKYAPAYIALAKSFAATGENDRSRAMFQKAETLAPKDASIPLERGACLARAKEWDGAIEALTRSLQMDPNNVQGQKWLGFTLTRSGRYDEGLAVLAKCMPEAEARYNLARMLQHNQQAVAAEQQLRLALQADPNFEPARELLGLPDRRVDAGVRTANYEEVARPAAPVAEPTTAPRRLPVMLGGGGSLTPVPPAAGGN